MIDIYLCDDDGAVRRRIEHILKQKILIEDYDMQIVCSASTPRELLDALKENRQNIYFLDVELKDGQWDGFLLGRELRRRDPYGTLIYITSYGDLAFRTFQYHLEAFDYIVKTPGQLEGSVCRCLEEFHDRLCPERQSPRQIYTIRTGTALKHIPLDQILFFETASRSHHVLLHTADSCIDFLGSLNEIEAELGKRFFRTHRSYLVALDKIEEIDFRRGRLLAGGLECLIFLLAGCSKTAVPDMALVQPDVSTLAIPEQVKVVGLGESSHGVKEYQELKAEVFQTLVRDYGCRTFILECDFGNALKVDSYIHGGEGTAKDAAALTGFRIYRTKEMEELLDWMRAYNETAPEGKDLHFYGIDMQSADNSKEYLFDILRQADPELCEEYEELLAFLNDTDMYDISTDAFAQAMPDAQRLVQKVDEDKNDIEAVFGSEAFDFARECACSIYNCCDIRKSNKDYNQVRDGHMAEKIEWFLEHGDGSLLFLTGHNGHVGRINASSYYDCLGKRLSETLGDQYFAIGTDAATTTFNSQGAEGFTEKTVKNENDLNALADQMEGNRYYIDLAKAVEDDSWHSILSEKQRMTTLNVGSLTFLKVFCTLKLVPEDAFNGMVIFDQVSPTTVDL